MTQFIARVQMINLFHIILYHVTIGLNEIVLVNKSYVYLGEPMNYHDTRIYCFDTEIILSQRCNKTTQFGINCGIQYDNSNTGYQILFTNDPYLLAHSHQTIFTISTIRVSYLTTYNRYRWQHIMQQQHQFQHHL